jgi:2-succinyl-6-hydroxy-2,4-cyclohexadiene-1-carboxylate synthase
MTDATASELVDERAQEDVLIERLLLLHGFTATGRSWDAVRRRIAGAAYDDVRAPDLRGHGTASATRPATIDACVADLRQDAPYTLAGYSMGGRIALHLALGQPQLVKRLVLVSTTAGIETSEGRAERRRADDELAEGLERAGLETFARWWAAQPLFAGQAPEVAASARADRLRNTAEGLAASLRGMGTGAMTPVWERLHELTMPATVVVGERDAKFRALGERLVEQLPDADLVVVPKAGHAVHLEAPEAVAAALAPRRQPLPGATPPP